jgi:hypothetical protein
MAQLNERVAQVPQLAGLKDGDRVIISDDGKVTGSPLYSQSASVTGWS